MSAAAAALSRTGLRAGTALLHSAPLDMSLQQRVFNYWFDGWALHPSSASPLDELPLNEPLNPKYYKRWFGADAAADVQIKTLFQADLEEVAREQEGRIAAADGDAKVDLKDTGTCDGP